MINFQLWSVHKWSSSYFLQNNKIAIICRNNSIKIVCSILKLIFSPFALLFIQFWTICWSFHHLIFAFCFLLSLKDDVILKIWIDFILCHEFMLSYFIFHLISFVKLHLILFQIDFISNWFYFKFILFQIYFVHRTIISLNFLPATVVFSIILTYAK